MARICRVKYQEGENYRVRKDSRDLLKGFLKSLTKYLLECMNVHMRKLFRLKK